ncbi:MFS transporter [candidate division KSB1 bacterium]
MERPKRFQLSSILTISIAHMIHDIYTSFLAPILPLLIEKLTISYAMAGFLSMVQRLPSLLNPFVGIIADKISVRYFIIIAPTIAAVSMSLLGAAPHYIALVILLFVMGIGSTIFHVPGPVMIKQVAGDRIGKGMSYYMLGGEIARTVGPLTILGAVSLWGLEGTYRLIPFGVAASLILFWRLKKIKISKVFIKDKKENSVFQTLLQYLPLFITLTGIILFRSTLKSALTTFLPTYMTAKGESLWFGGISLSILQFAGAGGSFFCGTISDKIGRKATLLIVSILSPVFMILFAFLDGIFVTPLLTILGFSIFAQGPVLLAVIQDLNSERPAFINGVYMTINFMVGSIGVLAVGILGDVIGLENTYILSAVLAVGAIPFVLKLPGKKK